MASTQPYMQQLLSAYSQMGSSPMPSPTQQSGDSKTSENGDSNYQPTWWDRIYNAAENWELSPSQENPYRGVMQDAYYIDSALRQQDYTLSTGMLANIGNVQAGLIGHTADLNLRNSQQLMAAEHDYSLAGMSHANELAKDMLQNQTASNVRELQETGLQQRLLTQEQGTQERGTLAEQGYQTRANTRVTGQEQRALTETQGAQARLGYAEQGYQNRQLAMTEGEQQRATTRVQGQENRALAQTQGDITRRNLSHDRDDALRRATSLNRRG